MNDKYYMPATDELHYGFEFESYNGSGFHQGHPIDKKETDFWKEHMIVDGVKLDWALQLIETNNIRVKLLDQSDIESLGWKYFDNPDGKTLNDNFYVKTKGLGSKAVGGNTIVQYRLRVIGDIMDIWCEDMDAHFFSGIIRNKSELIKLFKQLSI